MRRHLLLLTLVLPLLLALPGRAQIYTFQRLIGAKGTGSGQYGGIRGTVVDPAGRVLDISDANGYILRLYAAVGGFLGTCDSWLWAGKTTVLGSSPTSVRGLATHRLRARVRGKTPR